ncbi:MAG: hypothetical protein KKE44_05490 [Proteobacteria bacterium]|nr:hypothetical protein [Pseudomonadota bacterium]MBU1582185.1 hypothetical protein [Pseudomonadota bacterium]MBU2453722.1 hypothetical protein [Pseudomonadota bacterium]MBU2631972.1 hypothetical protein [Pseudomonadota bacterium]
MAKKLTIQHAVEEFELYGLYNDIIESYGEDLEDPSLVSDLYDLIDEYDEEFEFWSDPEGDFSESFERNLRDAITTIVEENEDLSFVDDDYPVDDDIPEVYDSEFEESTKDFGVDLDDSEEPEEEEDF